MIRIPEVVIRISIPKSVFGGEEVKFGLVIRIPEIVIRILIPESFLNSEKVKFRLVIRIPKVVIRIPNVKAANKSWICILTKMDIFFHVSDIFWIWLFLEKMKIREKYF